jgi:hypothetical protein
MLKYRLEEKLEDNNLISYCEICGKKSTKTSVNEFRKDGTIKKYYTCSNHIVDLYNKIMRGNNRK